MKDHSNVWCVQQHFQNLFNYFFNCLQLFELLCFISMSCLSFSFAIYLPTTELLFHISKKVWWWRSPKNFTSLDQNKMHFMLPVCWLHCVFKSRKVIFFFLAFILFPFLCGELKCKKKKKNIQILATSKTNYLYKIINLAEM